ncbi:NitT/TauT family transport system ATP-binding protein [Bacillus oleivorans]|uniref:NitT/TauT family transport system ATP-binding protein n=1 Tax=Bacillus oleivorans TaxID=1448271 RepID=A0A285CUL5_9BACI|nr:ABC transporter ATP-binding protein [Bacillus oleivorans]SNX71242.1 NitT/TauT family transport system ATP-binding protein [Bacillus oleivorans]
MSFLSVEHVHHTYFTKKTATTALEDIHFTSEEGEFISLLGPSGCGKTTLLSIIAGLFPPTEGRVSIEGKSVLDEASQQVGYMLQQDYLFPWKTIKENITLGLKLQGQLNPDSSQRVLDLLKEMGLAGVEDQYPKQLSGGMRQRVALVRTLSTNPKLLLLDEPFSALDFQTKLKLEDLVWETLKSFKKTAVLVTHDIGEAIAMSDTIYLLSSNPGKIHKIFHIPEQLKELKPFHARQHSDYSNLFQEIWKELENLETKA